MPIFALESFANKGWSAMIGTFPAVRLQCFQNHEMRHSLDLLSKSLSIVWVFNRGQNMRTGFMTIISQFD